RCVAAPRAHPGGEAAPLAHHPDPDRHAPDHPDAHPHHGHDHADIDWAEMAPLLESQAELFTPLYERALSWLAKEVTEPGLVVDDRKSTRLNSSHVKISYAVFCLKKKK